MNRLKRTLALSLSLAIMAATIPVEAKVGGGSSSVSSSSSSRSVSSFSSSRAGGGSSSGMQRSSALNQARAQSPKYQSAPSAPSPSYSSGYSRPAPAPAPAAQPSTGYSGKQVLGAAAVAGVGGYLLGHANSDNQGYANNNSGNHNGGGNYNNDGGNYADNGSVNNGNVPAQAGYGSPAYSSNSGSSGSGVFGAVFLLMMLGGIGYFAYRYLSQSSGNPSNKGNSMYNASSSTSQTSRLLNPAEAELLARAPAFFRELQDANNAGDKKALERLVDAEFLPTLISDIDTRTAPSRTLVKSLSIQGNRVLDFVTEGQQYVGSIHYIGVINEGTGQGDEDLEEMWNFVRDVEGGQWKLAGIEQV